jgi:hypothetical protein
VAKSRDEIIKDIRAGKFNRKELEGLYANARRLGDEEIMLAAMVALKVIDPRSYSRRFVKPIRVKIEEIAHAIAKSQGWAAWEGNKVGNRVKPGGPMRSGEVLAESYISYRKAGWKGSSYLAVFQRDEESAVQYKVKPHDGGVSIVETSEEAIALFRRAIES